jgi:hypothetical protein
MKYIRSYINIEDQIAGNWPHLWSYQPLVVLSGCMLSILIISWILAEPYIFSSREMVMVSSFIALGLTIIWMLYWLFRVAMVPVPRNIVDYRTLPKFTFCILIIIAILLGPLLAVSHLGVFHSDWDTLNIAFIFAAAEIMFFGVFSSWMRVLDNEMLWSSIFYAFVIGLALGIMGFSLVWVGDGVAAIILGMCCFVVFALVRLIFCIRAGRRTDRDGGVILVGIALLLAGIVLGTVSAIPELTPLMDLLSALPTKGNADLLNFAVRVDPRLTLPVFIILAISIDLSNWVLARFSLLPKVER